ncbi:XRN 5'-3' exonuclease N-terminus-domain-containing protein [Phycomyces blakesleeanus]
MGVPAFFRWLSDKFPKVASQVVEEQAKIVNGVTIPVDTTKPNPNGEEFDNLYLDMNGIIHPCCHPEDKPAPETEDDMMIDIFEYLDRIVDIVRPRQVLYMAIDGVAPRAKMNQQRARRFRASQLAAIERAAAEKVANELRAIGQAHQLPPDKKHFDSNCITPGTPFMAHLATCLRYHIAAKQNSDPLWKNLKVVLSDATVPGEGEHKMMEYIRAQRTRPEHNPNTSHVIYGLDADLIMLALGTHEPHFKILREDVFVQQGKKMTCFVCKKPGHTAAECNANARASGAVELPEKEKKTEQKPYVFLHVNILREYLEHALKFSVPGVNWDLERAIDDWVFMCFFVGNDFLPHLPSLEIREGAISTLSLLWKQVMPVMGGYMTHNGEVDLKRVQIMVHELGKMEDSIFIERKEKDERRAKGAKRRKLEGERRREEEARFARGPNFGEMTAVPVNNPNSGMSNSDVVANRADIRMANQNASAAAALRAQLLGTPVSNETVETPTTLDTPVESDDKTTDTEIANDAERGIKRKADEVEGAEATIEDTILDIDEDIDDGPANAEETDLEAVGKAILEKVASDKKAAEDAAREREPDDAVRLWETGWKERYYNLKFGIQADDHEAIQDIVKSYCEGLCWVFKYYYKGCVSWSWYYPYHYAPMASSFGNMDTFDIKFELSAPLKPFEQLMGVLPAASRDHIPTAFHSLMTDERSPIIDFYPTDFEVDMDGKKWEWQGVVKLPFIDTGRLIDAMNTVYDQISDEERHRNSEGPSILFVAESHKLYDYISTVYAIRTTTEPLKLDTRLSDGMTGSVDKDPECIPRSTLRSPLPEHNLGDIANDKSISVIYILPEIPSDYVFVTHLLRGIKLDKPALTFEDIQQATFEKTDTHRGGYNKRSWTPQIQHLEEYREHNTIRHSNRGRGRGGYGGGGYEDGARYPIDPFYNHGNQGGGRGGRGGGRGGYQGGYQDHYAQGPPAQQQWGYGGGGYNQGYGGGVGNHDAYGYNSGRGHYRGGGNQGYYNQQGNRGGYQNNQGYGGNGGYRGGGGPGMGRGGGRGGRGGYNGNNRGQSNFYPY